MKRLLLIIPIFLLLALNSCTAAAMSSDYPPDQWTAMAQTVTAAAWTITPISTIDPNLGRIMMQLNTDLSTTDTLGHTIDADYKVTNVLFQPIQNSSATTFVIEVRCVCVDDTSCCTPARTFVAITDVMRRNPYQLLGYVQSNVIEMKVVCIHKGSKIGTISAPWFETTEYLKGNTIGNQFGAVITPSGP